MKTGVLPYMLLIVVLFIPIIMQPNYSSNYLYFSAGYGNAVCSGSENLAFGDGDAHRGGGFGCFLA